MSLLPSALAVLVAYLIGSLSFAILISRVVGLKDPRSYGSSNPGATNVLRGGHRPAAVATLALDTLKGYLPVMAAYWLMPSQGWGVGTVALVGLAAFAGHLWPVFHGFKGGKGVATAAGVILALNPTLGLLTLLSFAIVTAFSRYVSLASIVAAVFAPFYEILIWGGSPIAVVLLVIALLVIWRHMENIRRLIAGTESRLGSKTPPASPKPPAHH